MEHTKDLIQSFLKKEGWEFSFDDINHEFEFEIYARHIIKILQYTIKIDDNKTIITVSPLLIADADNTNMIVSLKDFVKLTVKDHNYVGSWDVSDDGTIRYLVEIEHNSIFNEETLRKSIYTPILMYEQYGVGICSIIFEQIDPQQAYEFCQDPYKTLFHFTNDVNGDDIRLFNCIYRLLEEHKGNSDSILSSSENNN